MFALILIVFIGLGIALFAQQNPQAVSVVIGPYTFSAVPTFMIVLLSLLVGLIVAWMMSLMDFFSHSLTVHQKNTALNTANRHVSTLEQRLHSLREENAQLKGVKFGEATAEVEETSAEERTYRPNFFTRVKERLTSPHRKEALS